MAKAINITDSDVLDVINELAGLEDRKPHDTAKRLLFEVGKEKIAQLKLLNIHENANSSGEVTQVTKKENPCQS